MTRVGDIGRTIRRLRFALRRHVKQSEFRGSSSYWENRYRAGSDSGAGSYGRSAAFKAAFLNELVRQHGIASVIEFGCGDGSQLALADYPRYLGLDVSQQAVSLCSARFAGDDTKRFELLDRYTGETAELALSLDVVFHLVEDAVFESHMRALFDAATRFVVVYSTCTDRRLPIDRAHVRHRRFTDWIARDRPDWRLVERRRPPRTLPGARQAEFFVFAPAADR